jgi:hypothetical protein
MSAEERIARRFRFLKRLYDVTDGNKFASETVEQLASDTGIDVDEATNIAQYLAGKNLIQWRTMRGDVSITEWGVDEVERAESDPKEATLYFPPNIVNIMQVETMTGSQIQQGTVSSQLLINDVERASIEKLVAQIKDITTGLSLSAEVGADVDGHIGTIESQLRTSKPKRSIIREAAASLQELLSPFAAAAGALDLIQRLVSVLGLG